MREVCGVQAQDPLSAALAVRVRSAGLAASDIESAILRERSVVRTWCMRGTLHLLAAKDLEWLLSIVGPAIIRASRRRLTELGLDEKTCARGIRILREVLANEGPLSRAELADQLSDRGINLMGQAPYHLIRRAALEGIVCFGPTQNGEPTYVLVEDWIGLRSGTSGDDRQLAELARRYLGAYGPARPEDLAAWSGLTIAEARKAWRLAAEQLTEVEIRGRPAWMLTTRMTWLEDLTPRTAGVRLLPGYDTYLLGYADRDLIVAPQYKKRVNRGGGWIYPTLLSDGRVVGTWSSKQADGYVNIVVTPFEHLASDVHAALEVEAADLARFLEVAGTLTVMEPSSD